MATKRKMGRAAYTEPSDYFPKSVQDALNGKKTTKKTTKKSGTKKSGKK